MVLFLKELVDIWGAPANYSLNELNSPLGPICTDSRQLTKGCFFIPLIGEKFDAHIFLNDVFLKGAQGTVVSKNSSYDVPVDLLHWRVDDTLQALHDLALLYRKSLPTKVIAVTGSVGKTTTRELIRSSLAKWGEVISTKDNNNNDIGVPLTIFHANESHKAIVVEMGMRGLGQISRLSNCSRPDIAVITNIGFLIVKTKIKDKHFVLRKDQHLGQQKTFLLPWHPEKAL